MFCCRVKNLSNFQKKVCHAKNEAKMVNFLSKEIFWLLKNHHVYANKLGEEKKSLSNSGHFSPIEGHEAFRIRLEKHPVGQVLVPQVNVAIQSILGNPFKLLLHQLV